MANEKRLKLIDYDEIRKLFSEEYRKTAQLIRDGETHLDNLAEGFTEADRVIFKLPTVDAVEVVRCKDCRHRGEWCCPMYYEEEIEWDDDGYTEVDYVPHDRTTDDGFCDMGERREGE